MLPETAKPAPNERKIGRRVNQKRGSPAPARGPIIPTLTPEIAASSMSAPLARSSSKASVTPKIGLAMNGCVLKNSK